MSQPVMYLGASIYAAEDPFATALLVDDGQIAWMGTDTAAATLLSDGMERIDVDGALIAPAFVDSHVHLGDLGRSLNGLDLSGCRHGHEVLDAVAEQASTLPPGAAVLGQGWDESAWEDPRLPTPAQLQSASGDRDVYLARIDVHTALVSSSVASRAGLDVDRDRTWLPDERTHSLLRALVLDPSPTQRLGDQRAALEHLSAHGHAAVAEMAAPGIGGREDLELLLGAEDDEAAYLPRVYAYWAEAVASAQQAEDLVASFPDSAHRRVVGLGGDLSVDGSLGAASAALRTPYQDGSSTGELLLDVDTVARHVAACTRAGVQASFHAIGDAAVDTVLAGCAAAAEEVGERELRRPRHRIEHVEAVDDHGIAEMLRLGLTASVQPRFDELWGGDAGLYADRLGASRALALNPFGSLSAAGVPLALGSDAPVTGPDAWAAVAACLNHHTPQQRLPARAAFLAHTRAGYRAVREADPLAGTLRWGSPATFAIWEPSELLVASPDAGTASFSTDARARTPMLPDLDAGAPRCLRTVRDGRVLFDSQDLTDFASA